ncbi:hypothetical protein RJ640_021226 [Escallonia rubra]|uniref:Late embryogenesis abundant protein n=1 Tax=Escallonia rubra TaxID=112253 RepID=A0AA88U833_9ASTE|nr:hypothetical protein RJ640_021226 [Escallonia rubra]
MASQNPSSIYNTADNTTAQAQLKRDELINIPSNTQHYGQDPNFAQQTGDQVKTMAHGAANIATGAAQDEADRGVGVGGWAGAVVVGVGVGDGDVLEEGEVHDAVGDGEGRELDDVDGDLGVFRFEEEEVINDDDSGSQEEQEDRGHYARGKVGCTAGLRSVRLGREMFDRPGGKAGGRRRGRCRTGRACPGGAGGQAGGRRSGSRRRCSRRQAPAPCIGTASLQNEDEADRGNYARVFVEIHIVIQKRGVDFTVPAGKNPTQRQIEAGHTMEKGGGFASWACEDRRSPLKHSRMPSDIIQTQNGTTLIFI